MKNHTYLFIVGTHHSGTSLLKLVLQQHPQISGMTNTHVAEDEGQHLQNIYRNAAAFGGFVRYAFKEAAHMDENHPLATAENREKLFTQWSRYWDLSKPVLMEKSPRHPVMMRFLQEMFTPSRSRFLITLRHPMAYSRMWWSMARYRPSVAKDCGKDLVEHWLIIMKKMAEDVRFLQKAVVFQYEDLLATTVQAAKERLDAAVNALLSMENPVQIYGDLHRRRRSLLAFHGVRDHIVVHTGFQFGWTAQFSTMYDITSVACQNMINDLEEDVNKFGYSLRNFTNFWRPPAFDKVYI